jgi:hypothetical protein
MNILYIGWPIATPLCINSAFLENNVRVCWYPDTVYGTKRSKNVEDLYRNDKSEIIAITTEDTAHITLRDVCNEWSQE